MCATLNEDATFIFPQSDNYWCPSVTVGEGLYEPEIDWLMQRASDKPYAMLDCGANFGYWSVLASSAPYGRHAVVAIEASRANCELLRHNAQANGDRFSILHRAVGMPIAQQGLAVVAVSIKSNQLGGSAMDGAVKDGEPIAIGFGIAPQKLAVGA